MDKGSQTLQLVEFTLTDASCCPNTALEEQTVGAGTARGQARKSAGRNHRSAWSRLAFVADDDAAKVVMEHSAGLLR